MRPSIAVAVALAATACTEPESEPATTAVFAGGACQEDWICTGNSPLMGDYGYQELDPAGASNNAGVVLNGLWKWGIRYQPQVSGSHLTATAPGFAPLSGAGLVNAHFRLSTPGGVYRVYLRSYSNNVLYWRPPYTTVETYRLEYVPPGGAYPGDLRPLCSAPPPDSQVGDGHLWGTLTEAIFYHGDRYDYLTKRVTASTPSQSGQWFNIACAGSALMKEFLTGFTHASTPPGQSTTKAQRDDLLAMYTGNVCGTGRSFTTPGTPIRWGSSNGWFTMPAYQEYEAIWGGGRAQCLDTYRYPDLVPAIEAECGGPLPSCASVVGTGKWTKHGTIHSAIP